MLQSTESPELIATFNAHLAAYLKLTGLKVQQIRQDTQSLWIDWAYPDGIWAGTSCYDQPLSTAMAKLQRQIEDERQHRRAGQPPLIAREVFYFLFPQNQSFPTTLGAD